MLQITDLHASVEEQDILKGINLEVKAGEVHAIMGPNGSGKSTLASVIAGKEEFEITKGDLTLDQEDISEMDPEERAHKGVFLSFQYPVEIPGVTVTNFIKTAINETRKAKGEEDMPAAEMLKKIKEEEEILRSTTIKQDIPLKKIMSAKDIRQKNLIEGLNKNYEDPKY